MTRRLASRRPGAAVGCAHCGLAVPASSRPRGRHGPVLLQRLPAGAHACPRVGLRSVLPARRPSAGRARACSRLWAELRGFRRRPRAGGRERERRPRARAAEHAALPRRRPLRGLRVAGGEAAGGAGRRGRGPPELRQRRRGDHVAARTHAPVGHRPRARPPGLHPAPPSRGRCSGGSPGRRPRLTGAARRGGGLRDEPHVPQWGPLCRRVLRDGVPVLHVLPLAVIDRRGPGARVLGAPVLPDGGCRPSDPARAHRPSRRDRARHHLRGQRLERRPRQRADLVRFARDARRGTARRPADPAQRAAGVARTRRQPARRRLPRIRPQVHRAWPRRAGCRGAAHRARARRPGRGPLRRTGSRRWHRPVRPLVARQRRADR